jgi:N-acetylneuraminate synthase
LPEGHILHDEDVYLAIPLLRGQISCRELMRGEALLHALNKDEPIRIDDIDSPYANIPSLRKLIYSRGLPDAAAAGPLAVVGSANWAPAEARV